MDTVLPGGGVVLLMTATRKDPAQWNPADPYCSNRPLSDTLSEWSAALLLATSLAFILAVAADCCEWVPAVLGASSAVCGVTGYALHRRGR
jgi:hypothetical protein